MSLLVCQELCKTYHDGSKELEVLNDVSLTMGVAEQVAIVGASGSGKSTLLHILGALDKPTSGKVEFEGEDIFAFNEKQQAQFRNRHLGFVYQQHHLLPEFSALENVAMPKLISGENRTNAFSSARELLERVGLTGRSEHRPAELSGGERQRVAIARSLVMQPKLVLADEPTGNLDDDTGEEIYKLLLSFKQDLNTSFIVVTHDNDLADKLDRKLLLRTGHLVPADGQ